MLKKKFHGGFVSLNRKTHKYMHWNVITLGLHFQLLFLGIFWQTQIVSLLLLVFDEEDVVSKATNMCNTVLL